MFSLLHTLKKIFGVSGGHKIISKSAAEQLQFDQQWQNTTLPKKQLAIVQKELRQIKQSGTFPPHMQALIDQLKSVALPHPSILEIGCSSGYYNEILALANLSIRYEGCDYSEAFIRLAKQLYPTLPFKVEDATKLTYAHNQFDIAISGCCILHILDYPKAIAETARVAKQFAIFSRTPILRHAPTTYTRKKGYGVAMIEIFFNEQELLQLFKNNGLRVKTTTTFAKGPVLPQLQQPSYITTYLCEKLQ